MYINTHTCMYVCTHNDADSHAHTMTWFHMHTHSDIYAQHNILTHRHTHIYSDANTHKYKCAHKWHTHVHLHIGTTIINACIHLCIYLSWVRRQSRVLIVVFFTCYGHAIIKIEVHYEFTILSISCSCTHVLVVLFLWDGIYLLDTV